MYGGTGRLVPLRRTRLPGRFPCVTAAVSIALFLLVVRRGPCGESIGFLVGALPAPAARLQGLTRRSLSGLPLLGPFRWSQTALSQEHHGLVSLELGVLVRLLPASVLFP